MFDKDEGEWSAFRQRVLYGTGVALVLTAAGFLIYGPAFAISTITVSGTRLVTTDSVQRVAERYLNGQRWFVLPNRTLWILSQHGLEQHITTAISKRLSIEGVTVTKHRPRTLTIEVHERTPIANWTNGATIGTVDRAGVIIETRTELDTNLPIILDKNQTTFSADTSVAKREVMAAVTTLGGALKQANFTVEQFLIPIPVCPPPVVPSTTTNSSNTNAPITNSNISIINANTVNTNIAKPIVIPCDVQELRYSSAEVHVQLKDGPLVLFDRHNDLGQAVSALQRVMSQPGAQSYQQVDVRFGDRVYVK